MALWDEIKLRYPLRFLAELTNPNAEENEVAATDDAYGTRAANAAEKRFLRYAALETLDLTNEDEIEWAGKGTILILKHWTGEGQDQAKQMKEWHDEVVLWSLTDTRRRADPTTSSTAQAPVQCGNKPWSDPSRLEDLAPDNPPARQNCDPGSGGDLAIS